jgi:hypothetical protein
MRVVWQTDMRRSPHSIEGVNQVAIYDDDDEPLAMMWKRDDGTIALTRAGERDFENLVQQLDLHKRADVCCITL